MRPGVTEKKHPRLKSLELQGYKTFASKHDFQFAPTVTAVIGPNGSGKSNIADAIRWVLGEQSYSLLRGKKTEDMIFSGSDTRPRASMASATVTFDNTDGWLPIDFSEVTISRRAYRDGQNEYLLNGQRVRLRDVSELLASSGLAQRTYTIIGQGLVDAALSLKAEERRRLFEEAAGIGLYRSRREEAIRRLDTTRRNLERVKDILAELRPRLRSLERQMRRADTFEQVRRDLDATLQTWYGFHWYRQLDLVKAEREEASVQAKKRNDLRKKQRSAENELHTLRNDIASQRAKLRAQSDEMSELYAKREALGRTVAVSEERLRGLSDQRVMIQAEMESTQDAVQEYKERLASMEAQLATRQQTLEEANAVREALRAEGAVTHEERDARRQRVAEVRREIENASAHRVKFETRMNQARESLADAKERLKTLQPQVEEAKQTENAARETLETSRKDVDENAAALENAQQTLESLREELALLEQRIQKAETLQSGLVREKADLETRLDVLKDRPDEAARAKHILDASSRGKVGGIVGLLRDLIEVPVEFEVAIAAALGEFAGSLAMQDEEHVDSVLDWLYGESGNPRAALVPLQSSNPVRSIPAPSGEGMIGNAAELVASDAERAGITQRMLGSVWLVSDRPAARRWLAELPPEGRIVTLTGDVFFGTGQVLAGAGEAEKSTRQAMQTVQADLTRTLTALGDASSDLDGLQGEQQAATGRLKALQADLDELQTRDRDLRLQVRQEEIHLRDAESLLKKQVEEIERLEAEIEHHSKQLAHLKDECDSAEALVTSKRAALEEAIDAAEKAEPSLEMARVEARLEVARQSMEEGERQREELEASLQALEQEVEGWASRLSTNQTDAESLKGKIGEAESSLEALDGEIETVRQRIEPGETGLREAEQKRSLLEQAEAEARAALQIAERRHSHVQIELARREEELASLQRRIEDDFGLVEYDPDEDNSRQDPLPLGELVQRLPRVHELPEDTEEQLRGLRVQLRRLGSVNPEARREYREVNQRVDFLTNQIEDLEQAESQLQEVIAELDMLMERELRKTFEEVAVAFKETFTRLFDGGNARLTLTDPEDLTISGIDIEARLPGRREQGLAMLSGGERSLTASALIFALLKVSPTPFCLMDEVDAMLDETNVGRFTELLHELSEQTQFLVITHNRQTVQTADVVYGVSMGADSASRVISLKLDEAELEIMKE